MLCPGSEPGPGKEHKDHPLYPGLKNCPAIAVSEDNNSDVISNLSTRVSEDINEMVEQIQAIQDDISELAGRPISLYGNNN